MPSGRRGLWLNGTFGILPFNPGKPTIPWTESIKIPSGSLGMKVKGALLIASLGSRISPVGDSAS